MLALMRPFSSLEYGSIGEPVALLIHPQMASSVLILVRAIVSLLVS